MVVPCSLPAFWQVLLGTISFAQGPGGVGVLRAGARGADERTSGIQDHIALGDEQARLDQALEDFPASLDRKERWRAIAEAVGTRNATRCRERWENHLNPEINKSDFTAEEDAYLLALPQTVSGFCAYETTAKPPATLGESGFHAPAHL